MYTFPPIAAGVALAYSVVTALTAVLTPLIGAASAAAAVVCLTVLVRLALLPLSYAQVRGEKGRARLAPEMAELRRRFGHDPQRLLAEQQRLHRKEGVSPLAGCLPGLAQVPVFVALYGTFISATVSGEPNALLGHTLGGVPLGASLSDVVSTGAGPHLAVFVVLLAVLAGVAWASRRWLTLPALNAATGAAAAASGGAPRRSSGAPAKASSDGAAGFTPGMGRVLSLLPFGTVAIAAFVPLAAGLYLATTTAWTLAERLALRHFVTG